MAFFLCKFDTQLVVYKSVGNNLTGFHSEFVSKVVPATGKTIQGFQFDEAFWRSDTEENNDSVEATLWDPSTSKLEDNFQTGVGDNEDLLVDQIIVQTQGIPGLNLQTPERIIVESPGALGQNVYLIASLVTTDNATSYTSPAFTPEVGDLIVVVHTQVGQGIDDWLMSFSYVTLSDSAGGAYTEKYTTGAFDAHWSGNFYFSGAFSQVRTTAAPATSMTVTIDNAGHTALGCTLNVLLVKNPLYYGNAARRQAIFNSANESNDTPTAPSVTFASPTLPESVVIGYVGSRNPASLLAPSGLIEYFNDAHTANDCGAEIAADLGWVGTVLTWEGSAIRYRAHAIELYTTGEEEPSLPATWTETYTTPAWRNDLHNAQFHPNAWLPKIIHGYYYNKQHESYLYSDDGLTKYPSLNQLWTSEINPTISGGNYINLEFKPKPGIPILARSFIWNTSEGYYEVDDSIRKVTEFTPKFTDGETLLPVAGDELLWNNLSLGQKEFIVNYTAHNPMVVFNQQVVQPVGRELTVLSGYSSDELEAMETVGIVSEQDFQEHHLRFSPIDATAPIQIILQNGTDAQEYTVVSGFSVSGVNEVEVDYDLGILRFGSIALGGRPLSSNNIHAYYHKTFALEYEPINSRDYVLNTLANINPMRRFRSDGFVLVRQQAEDPTSLVLEAELPEIESNYFGPLFIGNNFSRLFATVTTKRGQPIEGQEIFFEILQGPPDATFGSDLSTSAISNEDGIARTLLNPPRRIDQLGGITDEVFTISGTSQLFLPGYIPPGDNDSLSVLQVHTTDDILGIPKTDLLDFYEDFIIEQGTSPDQTQGPLININLGSLGSYGWITGAYQDFIKWEVLHRAFHRLTTPITYSASDEADLRIGKKTVIAVLDNDAINPHTGITPAFVPVQPISYTVTETGTFVNFDQVLPPATDPYKAYLVIGPTKVQIRAYTINQRTGQTLYSNTIEILLDIPDTFKGLAYVDAINSMPSGLLGNALFYDQKNIELESVNITTSGLLPIGWRIRSPGITIASALDSITFLDINPLNLPADGTIGHRFTVD